MRGEWEPIAGKGMHRFGRAKEKAHLEDGGEGGREAQG